MTHNVATIIGTQVRAFWDARGDEGAALLKETKHLRMLLFRKKKLPVEKDLWIPGAFQPGE